MANKKTTTKVDDTIKVDEIQVTEKKISSKSSVTESELKQQLSETNAQLAQALQAIEQLKQMQTQSQYLQPVVSDTTLKGKKIKVVSLMEYQVNISTEPMGAGKIFTFDGYGTTLKIKFDDLEDCYTSSRKIFENGMLYIADVNAVEELGLTEDYQKLYDKKTVDKIVLLKTELDVDMFLNMSEDLQDSTSRKIAENMANGDKYDLNLINMIEESSGIDFNKMSSDIKQFTTTS